MSDNDKLKSERRLFLEKAGRFAAATPPTIALMLSVGGVNRAQAQSGGSSTTTTVTTSTTV
jgi:hypothetical protein